MEQEEEMKIEEVLTDEATETVENKTTEENEIQPEEINEEAPDVEAMIAEAEERGYLRAKNEMAQEMMSRPALGDREEAAKVKAHETEVLILNRMKRSVWE